MSSKETILSTRSLYHGRVLDVRLHRVRLENGGESERELVHHRGSVGMVAVTETDEVLLVRQFRLAAGDEILEIPAGTLEPGEEPRAAAERELEEEIGMRAGRWEELADFFVSPGTSIETLRVFLATELGPGSVAPDEDESLEIVRMPLDEAIAMCVDGRIRDAKTITGLLLANGRLSALRGMA